MEQSKFYQIKNVTECEYTLVGCDGSVITRPIQEVDKIASAFTIQDAKDGDVLRIRNLTFIFQEITNNNVCHKDAAVAYCSYEDNDDGFCVCGPDCITDLEIITPATKEQSEKLFVAMHEAGYEWNAEKKELKKIEQKPAMIQWKGDNLKEVIDFTGKAPQFDKWFKTFDEYEQYVHEHNNIFKLFYEDGSHYEVPIGAWIVRTPDGYNVASKAIYKQNLAWSEEDKKTFGYLEDIVNFCYRNQYVVNVQTCEKVRQLVFRLKSLCFQSRWSKDDIIRINEIIETLNIVQTNRVRTQRMHYNKATIDKNIEWLKSLYQDLKRL